MPPPRSDLGLPSPITQRIASSRFDLPQPLGPTTPVRPGSMRSSDGSTKLLKPLSFSRRMRNLVDPPLSSLARQSSAFLISGSSRSHDDAPSTSLLLIRKAGVPGTL